VDKAKTILFNTLMIQTITPALLKRIALLSMLLLTIATLGNAVANKLPHSVADKEHIESITSTDCTTCESAMWLDAPCANEGDNTHDHNHQSQHHCQSSSLFLTNISSAITNSINSVQFSDYTAVFSLNPTAPHTRPPKSIS
jgi:hypothetical protein